jgi:hypothetical protein
MTPLAFVIVSLAAARLTRLVTDDTITEPLRVWASDKPFVYELVTCPWCIGFHISVACVSVWWLAGDKGVWVLAWFAVSYVAGWLNSR